MFWERGDNVLGREMFWERRDNVLGRGLIWKGRIGRNVLGDGNDLESASVLGIVLKCSGDCPQVFWGLSSSVRIRAWSCALSLAFDFVCCLACFNY
jgi:hypothetical protein